jgi:outer membrane receptor protein involved in Fe transport
MKTGIVHYKQQNIKVDNYTIKTDGLPFQISPASIIFIETSYNNSSVIFKLQSKFKWYGGFNILDQYIPDQRRLFYTQDENDPTGPYYALLGAGSSQKSGSIFYSNLSDYIYNAGGDISKSFDWLGNKQTIKGGYVFQVKDRLFDSRPFFLNTLSNDIRKLPADQIFAPQNFGTDASTVQFGELTGKSYRYLANSILNAGYIQLDNQFSDEWRLVWGVRVEDFDQLIGSVKTSDERHVHTQVTDFLPGVNLTFKPNEKTNIRLSGSQTIVRPEFRELSPFAFYDFELNAQVVGNNKAKRTKISNFDLRYEIYPGGGELVTLGAFYKRFKDPLEYYFNRTGPATNTFNVSNSDKATSYGAEFEFRKKLDFIGQGLKNFTLSGNLSYIYSRVKDTTTLDRPLQGQSPYVINFGLQYDAEEIGFSSTLLFNQIGRRILFVGNEAVPDIWENPRPLLDLQLAQKFFKRKVEMRINISDIFNQRAFFYHDLDTNNKYKRGSRDVLAINRSYGTNYSITFGYTIQK